MTSAQVVETSVNVISNSPSQDYTHPDDRTLLYDMTPGFKPFTISQLLKKLNHELFDPDQFVWEQARLKTTRCIQMKAIFFIWCIAYLADISSGIPSSWKSFANDNPGAPVTSPGYLMKTDKSCAHLIKLIKLKYCKSRGKHLFTSLSSLAQAGSFLVNKPQQPLIMLYNA